MQLRELCEYAAARKRRFDAVCVWKLDRWGRSVADSIKSILELTSLGVRFVAVTQNIDTDETNPMARFLLHIMAAFAELEREIIRERVVAGVKAAKANGKQLGLPRRNQATSRTVGAMSMACANCVLKPPASLIRP